MEWIPFIFADPYHFEALDHYIPRSSKLLDILEKHLKHLKGWGKVQEGIWMHVFPKKTTLPDQGWKLHISATPASAPKILDQVLPELLKAQCTFKFLLSTELVQILTSSYWPRGQSGKFITIYPRDKGQLRDIAERCYQATRGLEGPRILSDRAYKQDGIVYYRYGGFKPNFILHYDGFFVPVIKDPQGKHIPDRRNPWFDPPPWVQDPFCPTSSASPPQNPWLKGRYQVEEALHFSNKGGVYKAIDRQSGSEVVIKEARPYVAADSEGYDAVCRLKKEFTLLKKLKTTGIVPAPLELFEYGGHYFLVEEFISGQTLRTYINQKFDKHPRLGPAQLYHLLEKLIMTLEILHTNGVIMRDYTPNNILITLRSKFKIVDLELAYYADGDKIIPGGTPGYMSPQQASGSPPSQIDDLFSLGALFFFILTGRDPFILTDHPKGRKISEIHREFLYSIATEMGYPSQIIDLTLKLLQDQPRIPLKRVKARLRSVVSSNTKVFPCKDRKSHELEIQEHQIVDSLKGIINYLTEQADFQREDRIWPVHWRGLMGDPLAVQYGASGVGAFLIKMLKIWHMQGEITGVRVNPAIEKLLHKTIDWCKAQLEARVLQRPPGLYFGLAGSAWFFLDAASILDDQLLLEKAKQIALSLPIHYPIPDIAHGLTGTGLTYLRFWMQIKEPAFLERATAIGEYLIQSAHREKDLITWPIPKDPFLIEGLSGKCFYGFAHGTAGMATFLLYLYLATKEAQWLNTAYMAGRALLKVMEERADCAYWPFGPDDPRYWPHWCNGSSGVGTALLRLHRAIGEKDLIRAAKKAANTVMKEKWRHNLGQCHGLAGNGEFLLDLFEATKEEKFLSWARRLARIIYMNRIYYRGKCVFPGEGMMRLQADYGTGMAGIGCFLLRCWQGGLRPFMLDELFLVREGG